MHERTNFAWWRSDNQLIVILSTASDTYIDGWEDFRGAENETNLQQFRFCFSSFPPRCYAAIGIPAIVIIPVIINQGCMLKTIRNWL